VVGLHETPAGTCLEAWLRANDNGLTHSRNTFIDLAIQHGVYHTIRLYVYINTNVLTCVTFDVSESMMRVLFYFSSIKTQSN
jgi:hypothetical protein